jgi:hypothetical protein
MTIIPTALLMILEYSVYIIICRTEENIFVMLHLAFAQEPRARIHGKRYHAI